MSAAMIFDIISAIAGAIAALIVVIKLLLWHDNFNRLEQIGMGMIGAAMVLTIPPVFAPPPNPFDDWSPALLRIGVCVYFLGRMSRHQIPNLLAKIAARRHLKRRHNLREE